MERAEQRAILKKLQGIVNGRADGEALAVLDEVREFVGTFPQREPEGEREEQFGFDRQEKRGRTRKE